MPSMVSTRVTPKVEKGTVHQVLLVQVLHQAWQGMHSMVVMFIQNPSEQELQVVTLVAASWVQVLQAKALGQSEQVLLLKNQKFAVQAVQTVALVQVIHPATHGEQAPF